MDSFHISHVGWDFGQHMKCFIKPKKSAIFLSLFISNTFLGAGKSHNCQIWIWLTVTPTEEYFCWVLHSLNNIYRDAIISHKISLRWWLFWNYSEIVIQCLIPFSRFEAFCLFLYDECWLQAQCSSGQHAVCVIFVFFLYFFFQAGFHQVACRGSSVQPQPLTHQIHPLISFSPPPHTHTFLSPCLTSAGFPLLCHTELWSCLHTPLKHWGFHLPDFQS